MNFRIISKFALTRIFFSNLHPLSLSHLWEAKWSQSSQAPLFCPGSHFPTTATPSSPVPTGPSQDIREPRATPSNSKHVQPWIAATPHCPGTGILLSDEFLHTSTHCSILSRRHQHSFSLTWAAFKPLKCFQNTSGWPTSPVLVHICSVCCWKLRGKHQQLD